MAKLKPGLPGVTLVDADNNVIDLTGGVTNLENISIVDSVLPDGAATEATSADMAAAIGSPSDAAWSGSGDATVISLLKKIALNTTP